MNIHDRARQMVQQSPHPMDLSEAYRRLSRRARRKNYGTTAITPQDRAERARIESPPNYRLPYADN